MTLKDCYRILGIGEGASLDAVKHAYRKRAFALHPDLNPDLPDASLEFQKLNEAYVILSKIVAEREARGAAEGDSQKRAGERQADAAEEKKKAAQEKAEKAEKEKAEKAAQKKAEKEKAEREKAGREKVEREKAEKKKAESEKAEKAASSGSGNAYSQQQEVLQDILNDSFARRVFEDIYREIRRKSPPSSENPESRATRTQAPLAFPFEDLVRRIGLALAGGTEKIRSAGKKAGQAFPASGKSPAGRLQPRAETRPAVQSKAEKGLGGMVRSWLRSQIDEELLYPLPRRKLVPGAHVRLFIRQGLSDEMTTLDVTLPPDFQISKPIRLKGMGKKVGSWQGDLYLRFAPKD